MKTLNEMALRKMRRTRLLCVAAGMIATLVCGCSKKGGDDEDAAKKDTSPTQVTLTKVVRADVSRMLQLSGSVAAVPNRDVKVSAQVPGRVTDLTVAEGDRVSAGQLIAKLDDHSFRDQVSQAEAGVGTAQASVENANQNLKRNEDLVQRGIAARKDLEDAQKEAITSASELKQAQAALSTARLQLSRTEIHSPMSGTVVKRFISGGEQVDGTAAAPIVEIANLGEVELNANVPASDISRMKEGQSIQMTSAAMPGKTYTGKIVGVSFSVDPASNAGLVRIRIPNGSGDLRLGMFLGAQVPVETHTRALTIPPGAIYRGEDGNPRVFVVQGDTANVSEIKLGIETPNRAEVLNGVNEGDTIILAGGYGLSDKAKVAVGTPAAQPGTPDKKDDKKDDK
jgi:cobalt-zinc-cadmium efflux system membrane fusion protein